MSHSRKLMVLALAATSLIGFVSLHGGATAQEADNTVIAGGDGGDGKNNPPAPPAGGGGDDGKNNPPAPAGGGGDDGKNNPPPAQTPPAGGGGDDGKNNPPPTPPSPPGGGGDDGKNNPPPAPPPAPNPSPRPRHGGGVGGGDGGFNQMARRFACYNGYQIVMVRSLRECGFGVQRRVVVNGGKRRIRAQGGYAYGGGYAHGGGYATGGGYGYAYPQPIVRYYKPASRAAVMQAQKRARRAAQYSYGAGYGYDNGGVYVGGYGYGNGGYPAGYGAQMGYGEGYVGVRRHKAKRAHRRHAQAYGAMGGYNAGYGYDAGYGAGFGYGGTTIHYGPIMTKDGAY
jgi:hypothetical protein